MGTRITRKVGDMHSNGKWAWTEYKPGKFDWRNAKVKNVEEEVVVEAPKPMFNTKKAFIAGTNSILTEEECEFYYNNLGKECGLHVWNEWSYIMGSIGNSTAYLVNEKTYKRKPLSGNEPKWRPLARYSYSVSIYSYSSKSNEYHRIEGFCQSWEEIEKVCQSSESFRIHIQKHPHQ